jgi:hypothetical protein
MGISGTVDTILHLDRARGEQEGNLKVTGRLIKEEQDLAIKFHKDLLNWQILGNSKIYSQSKGIFAHPRKKYNRKFKGLFIAKICNYFLVDSILYLFII